MEPGLISSIQKGFTQEIGCSAWHVAHDLEGLQWLTAAFGPQDNAGKCLQCHDFGANARSAHNADFEGAPTMNNTRCALCHSEQQGTRFEPSWRDNATCNNRHAESTESFHDGHPDDNGRFTYQVSNSIFVSISVSLDGPNRPMGILSLPLAPKTIAPCATKWRQPLTRLRHGATMKSALAVTSIKPTIATSCSMRPMNILLWQNYCSNLRKLPIIRTSEMKIFCSLLPSTVSLRLPTRLPI